MADEVVMETIYGKKNKYEVVKKGGYFIIRKNGSYHRGTFSSLAAAVEAAKSEN